MLAIFRSEYTYSISLQHKGSNNCHHTSECNPWQAEALILRKFACFNGYGCGGDKDADKCGGHFKSLLPVVVTVKWAYIGTRLRKGQSLMGWMVEHLDDGKIR